MTPGINIITLIVFRIPFGNLGERRLMYCFILVNYNEFRMY